MNQKGFIATSLIYSFFLIFCAVLLSFVGVYLHNRVLLNNITDDIKADLTGEKTIGATGDVGLYYKFPVFRNNTNISAAKWIVYAKDNTNVTLLSDSVLFNTNKYNNTTQLQNDYNSIRGLYLNNSTYLTNTHMNTLKGLYGDVQDRLLKVTPDYLYLNGSTPYYYGFNADTNSYYDKAIDLSINPLTEYGARVLVTISAKTKIIGGTGTVNNPYIINYYATNGLMFMIDGRNPYGNSASSKLYDLSGNYVEEITNNTISSNVITFGTTGYTVVYPLKPKTVVGAADEYYDSSIYKILNNTNGHTIEFKATSLDLRLSTGSYLVKSGVNLNVNGTSVNYTGTSDSSITLVKMPLVNSYKVFIDGKENTTIGNVLNTSNVASTLIIKGTINNLRIYNRALGNEEVMNNSKMDKWVKS